ncbi:MAG TPA: hypothetical protein VLW53_02935 [Candidatus Eisenbacteria bacterium]|nr:hypothetical protein [Candidatus Eisenbacteria bacterium]
MQHIAALLLLAVAITPPADLPARPAADADVAITSPVGAYTDPPFHCRFQRYGEGEAPPLSDATLDPLCVEYQKRDITVTDGGAVGFVLAEPARFAVATPVCRYWQIDHWSVQVSPDADAIVRWDGSYWFDKGRLTAAAEFRDFTLGGQTISAQRAADAVRPVSPQLADAIEQYGAPGGFGMGLAPVGDLPCSNPLP